MDYSRKISERLWNLSDKGEQESRREETFIDDIIQKSHIEKELLSHLDGIETVFDGGAGSGRFSILLAKHGCNVTHFDISQPMIDKAKELDFVYPPPTGAGHWRVGAHMQKAHCHKRIKPFRMPSIFSKSHQ